MNVRPLDRPEDPDAVLTLAWRVGHTYPQWVPYYLRAERRRLLRGGYGYFPHRQVETQGFGLTEGGQLVATVTAYVDPPLQQHLGRQVGFLGQFESLPGVDLRPMLDQAHDWLTQHGAREVWAPADCPFQIQGGGALTEGHERAAPFLSHWTPPHYAEVWEWAGYHPVQSYHNYVVDLTAPDLPDKIARYQERAAANGVTVRPADKKQFERDLRLIAHLYNATFDQHWGHGPLDVDDFVELTIGLKDVVEPAMVVFAERDGEPLGVRVAFPQYEPVFRVMDGELNWRKYLRLPFTMRRIKEGISLMVGVKPEARGLGIAPALSAHVYALMRRRGYRRVIHTAIFADNPNSQRQVGKLGGVRDQGWTIYGKVL